MEELPMNEFELKIQEIKKTIERHNKNHSHKRRRFSKKIKLQICNFIKLNNLSLHQSALALGITANTIKRWQLELDSTDFKRISIAQVKSKETNKFKKEKITSPTAIHLLILAAQILLLAAQIFHG